MREDAEEKRFGLKYSVYRWVLCGTESFKNLVREIIFSFDFEKWSKFGNNKSEKQSSKKWLTIAKFE